RVELRDRTRLALEACERLVVAEQLRREDLDRDRCAVACRLVDLAHRTASDHRAELERSERTSGVAALAGCASCTDLGVRLGELGLARDECLRAQLHELLEMIVMQLEHL